jgi:hypothetical protein
MWQQRKLPGLRSYGSPMGDQQASTIESKRGRYWLVVLAVFAGAVSVAEVLVADDTRSVARQRVIADLLVHGAVIGYEHDCDQDGRPSEGARKSSQGLRPHPQDRDSEVVYLHVGTLAEGDSGPEYSGIGCLRGLVRLEVCGKSFSNENLTRVSLSAGHWILDAMSNEMSVKRQQDS